MEKCCCSHVFSQSIHANVDQNFSGFPQMPFLPNPFYLYGNASMTPMPWGTPIINNSFAYTYPENASKSYSYSLKLRLKPKGHRPTPKVKG